MKITETENDGLLLSVSDFEELTKIEIELPSDVCEFIRDKVNEMKGDSKWNLIGIDEVIPNIYETVDLTIETIPSQYRFIVDAHISINGNWHYTDNLGKMVVIGEKYPVKAIAWSRKKKPYAG